MHNGSTCTIGYLDDEFDENYYTLHPLAVLSQLESTIQTSFRHFNKNDTVLVTCILVL